MSTSTLTNPPAATPATEAKAPETGAGRRSRSTKRFVAAGVGLAAALALALGAAALARDDSPDAVPAHADVVENGSPRAIEGTVEETAVVAANPGMATNGSPRAIDGTVEEAPPPVIHAHPSMIERDTPTTTVAPPAAGGTVAPAHPSMIEHGSPNAVDAG